MIFIGIDGGGTRATAVAIDGDGTELARMQGASGLVHPTDPGSGAASLADLAARVLLATGTNEERATSLCAALAGAGRDDDRRAVENALRAVAPARRVIVTTDAEAALFDAFHEAPGILVISGTGSIAWGRNGERTARTGGWGALLGDEGSGYSIGLDALHAAVRAHDGRGTDTILLQRILDHAGLVTPQELIAWSSRATKAGIAALAPIVFDVASEDHPARVIVEVAARDLALHVSAMYRRLMPWPERAMVALAGSIIAPNGPLRSLAVEAIRSLALPVDVLDRAVDGARGAADLARV